MRLANVNSGSATDPLAVAVLAGSTMGMSWPTDLHLSSLTVGTGAIRVAGACRWWCIACHVGDLQEVAAASSHIPTVL